MPWLQIIQNENYTRTAQHNYIISWMDLIARTYLKNESTRIPKVEIVKNLSLFLHQYALAMLRPSQW